MERCPWCGERQATPLLERRDRLGEERFRYLRCAGCGLVRLADPPGPQEIGRYYPPAYEAYNASQERGLYRWGRRRMWLRRLRAIEPHLGQREGEASTAGQRRALDIGCATGEFLELLGERGWEVYGIEPDPQAARIAGERLGAGRVETRSLEEADFTAGSFDLIALWDVLEHLYDPSAALERVAPWLRPAGLLVLGVPNLESWDARLFGSDWVGWDAPRHLFLFPDRTLRAMLAGAGLEVVDRCCCYGGYGSLLLSLDFALRRRLGEGGVGRLLRSLAGLRPWRYLLWPYFRLAERMNRGPIRTYICRRVS